MDIYAKIRWFTFLLLFFIFHEVAAAKMPTDMNWKLINRLSSLSRSADVSITFLIFDSIASAHVALSKDYFVLFVTQTCTCHIRGIFQRYFGDGNSIRAAAPSGQRNRSDRRPSTSVYRKFIRSHRHVTASPLWRGPTAAGERRRRWRGARKWKLLDIASIMVRRARQMARARALARPYAGGKRPRKVQPGKGIADKCFFIGQWDARKNVIAHRRRNLCSPAIFGRNTSRGHSRSRVAERAVSKGPALHTVYGFSRNVYSISKTFFHITTAFSDRQRGVDLFPRASRYRGGSALEIG